MAESIPLWRIRKYLTRRRLIAVGLIFVAIALDAWGYYEYSPLNSSPNITFPYYGQDFVGYFSPAVKFHVTYFFSARGALSVNNPIHIHAELYRASGDNISNVDFLQYYNALGFTNAFNSSIYDVPVESIRTEAAIPIKRGPYNISLSCPSSEYCPSGEYCPSYAYCADGDIIWVKEGPSWDYLWPTDRSLFYSRYFSQFEASLGGPDYAQIMAGLKAIDCPGDPNCRQPIITISGVADTLSVANNLTIQRLTIILMGFTIILLLEIVDTILSEPPREPPRRSPGKQLT